MEPIVEKSHQEKSAEVPSKDETMADRKKNKPSLRKINDSVNVSMNEDGFLKIGDREISIEATIFLYNMQQAKTRLHDPDYRKFSTKLLFHLI